jgi:hypothetical protein
MLNRRNLPEKKLWNPNRLAYDELNGSYASGRYSPCFNDAGQKSSSGRSNRSGRETIDPYRNCPEMRSGGCALVS